MPMTPGDAATTSTVSVIALGLGVAWVAPLRVTALVPANLAPRGPPEVAQTPLYIQNQTLLI